MAVAMCVQWWLILYAGVMFGWAAAGESEPLTPGIPFPYTCKGPWTFSGSQMRVFHIMSSAATSGIAEKNGASKRGDIGFIFGTSIVAPDGETIKGEGDTRTRGCDRYFEDGVMELLHVSHSGFNTYLLCNQNPPGSGKYTCEHDPHKPVPSGANKMQPGMKTEAYTGGRWYSFPKAGEGKHWKDEKAVCPRVRMPAKKLIKSMCQACGVPITQVSECGKCGKCIRNMKTSAKKKAWEQAFKDHLLKNQPYGQAIVV